MFLGQPFIVGGSHFNCKGTDDTSSPFYLRAIGTPTFSADGTNVSIDVRVASMTEMIWGRARLQTGISEADLTEGHLRRLVSEGNTAVYVDIYDSTSCTQQCLSGTPQCYD